MPWGGAVCLGVGWVRLCREVGVQGSILVVLGTGGGVQVEGWCHVAEGCQLAPLAPHGTLGTGVSWASSDCPIEGGAEALLWPDWHCALLGLGGGSVPLGWGQSA